jgi:hypothetical protein
VAKYIHPSQLRTIDHAVIRRWAEHRKGEPARVRTTTDALRIKIGADEPYYEVISWEKWFEIFDANSLAFVYEDPGLMAKVVRRKEGDEPVSTT